MRYLWLLPVIMICGCGQNDLATRQLQTQIDSLSNKLAHTYKPGFGEFMSGIQVHHAKLWYAGNAGNWPLAQFELDEIKEALDGIKQQNTDRVETRSLGMIDGALDSINNAVKDKSDSRFKANYTLLTRTCNNCHKLTNHAFNVIKTPETPPFSNQDFKGE